MEGSNEADEKVLKALRFAVEVYSDIPEGLLNDFQAQLMNELNSWSFELYRLTQEASYKETGYLKDNIVPYPYEE